MKKTTLNVRGRLVELSKPAVMGIINITPDSFYRGSRAESVEKALAVATQMIDDGADFLDLGAFSTRPGASMVDEEEELKRLIPVVEKIALNFPETIITIDTFRATVAREALEHGAGIVNDITGGQDKHMITVLKKYKAPYIIMHMRGPVTNMMDNLIYDNLLHDMMSYFNERIIRLQEAGIKDIIIDPGFGFSKSLDQNYEVLKNLSYFEALEKPVLVGASRKSMIYKLLNITPDEALSGTSVINFAALEKGAGILRVHDVKEAVDTVKLYSKLA